MENDNNNRQKQREYSERIKVIKHNHVRIVVEKRLDDERIYKSSTTIPRELMNDDNYTDVFHRVCDSLLYTDSDDPPYQEVMLEKN